MKNLCRCQVDIDDGLCMILVIRKRPFGGVFTGRETADGYSARRANTFELGESHRRAIESLAGGRKARLSGRVVGKKMVVDFLACAPSSLEQVIDELVQVNIGEIRTRIHQLLLRPVIMTYSAEMDHSRLSGLLQSILSDETRHVAYTATLLEAFIDQDEHLQDFIRTTFRQRLREFNEITLDEVDGRSFEGA